MKSNSKLGQVRVIEAVVASIIMLIMFTAAFYMLFSSEKFFKQEVVDLNRLAYNVLHHLLESNVVEEAVSEEGAVNELKLMNVVESLIPQNVLFNLTIWEHEVNRWNLIASIHNTPLEVFERASEIASAGVTYTSRSGKILYLNLILVRTGLT